MAKAKQTKAKEYTYASGRRREASARVRLYKGEGDNTVNGNLIGKYFPGNLMSAIWAKPFKLTNTEGKYYITAKVVGGGKHGQVEAIAHATAKALFKSEKDGVKMLLKKAGLLTRDPRTRERRKVGTGGKARRAKQSPKR